MFVRINQNHSSASLGVQAQLKISWLIWINCGFKLFFWWDFISVDIWMCFRSLSGGCFNYQKIKQRYTHPWKKKDYVLVLKAKQFIVQNNRKFSVHSLLAPSNSGYSVILWCVPILEESHKARLAAVLTTGQRQY